MSQSHAHYHAESHFHEPVDWFEKINPVLAARLPMMSAAEKLGDVPQSAREALFGKSVAEVMHI